MHTDASFDVKLAPCLIASVSLQQTLLVLWRVGSQIFVTEHRCEERG